MATKLISRISTLDAAKTIYFIVAGLAIKQSLVLFGHAFPQDWPKILTKSVTLRTVIGFGFLATAIRLSHHVAMIYGHEKEQIEDLVLPSASRISQLSGFLAVAAIPLYLMADNFVTTSVYVLFANITILLDICFVAFAQLATRPVVRIHQLRKYTEKGTAARAALWWIVTDLALMVSGLGYLFWKGFPSPPNATFVCEASLVIAGILIAGTILDYGLNYAFYFGGRSYFGRRFYFNGRFYFKGRKDGGKMKFVFVVSRLSDAGNIVTVRNINQAQRHCYELTVEKRRFYQPAIAPFASHAFYPYFLNNSDPEDRKLSMECALAYMSACDAVYVYLPRVKNGSEDNLDYSKMTKGMTYMVDAAKRNGLEIVHRAAPSDTEIIPVTNGSWVKPARRPNPYKEKRKPMKTSEDYFKGETHRKKVYVCTPFRGVETEPEIPEKEKLARIRRRMDANTTLTLWHCYRLATDPDEAVAPFAPQAFYPNFWRLTDHDLLEPESDGWTKWFNRSIEILKVCDAVYIYTVDGMPPAQSKGSSKEKDSSAGVMEVDRQARAFGLEVQYRKLLKLPPAKSISGQVGVLKAPHRQRRFVYRWGQTIRRRCQPICRVCQTHGLDER